MGAYKNPGADDIMDEARLYIHDPSSLALIQKAENFAAVSYTHLTLPTKA